MPLKLTMKGRLVIRRFNLESVILDGSLNKYKEPQLVIKPELEPVTRQSLNGTNARDGAPTRRQVLMIHVKDKANELEKLYLDTFSASPESGATDPTRRHTVTCSRLECSLVFRYTKDARDNRSRTLMVRFRATADLGATIDELNLAGVNVEDACENNQGLTRMAVHPQLQHLARVDQGAHPAPVTTQQTYYTLSPSPTMVHGFTPPPGALHPSTIMRPPSQPVPHFVTLQPGLHSWTPPPRPATTTGIPGILGEGIYKVSRVGASSSNRSRGRKLATISESRERSDHTVSRHFSRRLERKESFSRKRSLSEAISNISQADDRKAKLARFLSNKYSSSSRPTSATMTLDDEPGTRYIKLNELAKPVGRPLTSTITGIGSTELTRTHASRNSESSFPTTSTLKLKDLEELADPSQSRRAMPPPLTRENRMVQQLVITQEGLTGVTNVWNELMERGQVETEGIESLEEAQKVWARLGQEWVRQLHSRVATTVEKLNKLRC